MPEIAEVETVRNTLKQRILGKKIVSVDVYYEKMIDGDVSAFKNLLIGKSFNDIKRIGKWLIFCLDGYVLLSHLRMEGKFFIKPCDDEATKHEHVVFTFSDQSTLRYHDTRKFGRMILLKEDEYLDYPAILKQGIEPISKDLNKDYLYEKLYKKNIPMKSLLLDQSIISGLGNIYADEVLFAANVNPLKLGKDITIDECDRIVKASNDIILRAIECGGTTIRSYTSSLGVTGRFQQHLKVHKRENCECFVCHGIIKRVKVGGRSTYFCPNCQK